MSCEQFDLDPCIVETCAACDVGQRVRHERVRGRAVERAARPEALGQGQRPWAHLGCDGGLAMDVPEIVEDPD